MNTRDAKVHLNMFNAKGCPVQKRSHSVKPIDMNNGAASAAKVPKITDDIESVTNKHDGTDLSPRLDEVSPTPSVAEIASCNNGVHGSRFAPTCQSISGCQTTETIKHIKKKNLSTCQDWSR